MKLKPLVLIAEDDTSIAESLTFLLERADLDVAVAYDGAETVKTLHQRKPDLVILDITMQHLDGFEVLKTIRADPELKLMKVFVLTAKGRESDRRTAMELGADRFVTKPYSNKEVITAVQELLGLSAEN